MPAGVIALSSQPGRRLSGGTSTWPAKIHTGLPRDAAKTASEPGPLPSAELWSSGLRR